MATVSNTGTLTYDQDTLIKMKMLSRANLRLVAASICEPEKQEKGAGLTATFIRYERINVPVTALTEGTPPTTFQSMAVTRQQVTMVQWGDAIKITDVVVLTNKHPLVDIAIKLLADNAQRVIDREVQIVWLAGTNIMYPASRTARTGIISTDVLTEAKLRQASVTLSDAGAAPRGGPYTEPKGQNASGDIRQGRAYVAVCGPQIIQDVSSLANFISVAIYQNSRALFNAEAGTMAGIRFVESNFIPKFTLLGNSTAAVASTGSGGITGLVITAVDGGGSLKSSTTFFWKVTRKDLTRGFEEAISIAHSTASTATGDNESFTIALPSTAGYVYNVYFDTVSTGGTGTDATLGLVAENQAASATVTVTAVATSTTTPPPAITVAGTAATHTVHPIFIHGEESCKRVGFQNMEVLRSGAGATKDDPLAQFQTIGYKFMEKSMIANQNFMLRYEVASNFT